MVMGKVREERIDHKTSNFCKDLVILIASKKTIEFIASIQVSINYYKEHRMS